MNQSIIIILGQGWTNMLSTRIISKGFHCHTQRMHNLTNGKQYKSSWI
jgi:hypothetical protein